jgi:hypothetical protein
MPRGNVGVLGSTPMVDNAIQQAQAVNAPQQAAQPQQQQGTDIPYWGHYGQLSYFDYDPTNSAPGKEFLAGLQKYDPDAKFVETLVGGESPQTRWTLQSNMQKELQKYVDMNPGNYAAAQYSPNDMAGVWEQQKANPMYGGNFRGELFNPNAVGVDKNLPFLGRVTSRRNVVPDKPGWLEYVGPLAVGAFGGFLGGLSPFLSAAKGVQGALRSGSPWDLAGAALPFIPGINSVPFLSSGLKAGINYARRRGG